MRNKILDLLYMSNGPVSGQEISRRLGISRTAVWKHIGKLNSEGYGIKAVPGKGYEFGSEPDVLSEYEVKKRLKQLVPMVFRRKVDSTNNLAKEIARGSGEEFVLVTAETQEAGRGRMGRAFESDNKAGAWCSFILRPQMPPEDSLIVTIAAAIAVCRTLESACGLMTGIKWPNDIISSGKKICGILSEMTCETGAVEHIIAGIGINVLQGPNDFSPDVSKVATSVLIETGRAIPRAEITASLCYNMLKVYDLVKRGGSGEIMDEWSRYSVTDGKRIRLIGKNGGQLATAVGIDKQGRLITEDESGRRAVYNSGEISVRGIMGYI